MDSSFLEIPASPTKRYPPYSADYRPSHLETLTFGINATVELSESLRLDLGYKPYLMTD
ncbi:MAG: hypothetical protein M2R45_02466 [Verrucomicrobia subdivision 3 bacterium]|nr:hypothetical protein [Limisphaerales bacterium]MCS1413254.1 hypothetical protein [Limisphaerales bacterium]